MDDDENDTTASGGIAGSSGRAVAAQRILFGLISGVLAGFAALAVAELASAAIRPESSPLAVVGGSVIDATPPALKDYAVRHFGTNDKFVLELGILVILALFALGLGVLSVRLRRTASAGVLLFGVIGVAAAATRPDSRPTDVVPSLVGALAGTALLYVLAGRLRTAPGRGRGAGAGAGADAGTGDGAGTDAEADAGTGVAARTGADAAVGAEAEADARTGAEADTSARTDTDANTAAGAKPGVPAGIGSDGAGEGRRPAGRPAFDRRGFLVAAGAAAAASAGAEVLGRALNDRTAGQAAASRSRVRIPAPTSRAAAVPRGADLKVPGLSPFTTPNSAFYRVDTALVVPRVDASSWRLRLHGTGVHHPLELGYQDLLDRELIERDITLTCVSNQVGGPYVGNARWIGVPLAGLLKEAGVRPPSRGGPADQLVARSVDGMTIGSPVDTVMDGRDAMLAVGMNGEPLPFEHGFPVRMVVPGLYGFVSACKWLTDLELTTFDAYDPYWVKRGWSKQAPIKTESRIDTPKPFGSPKAGRVPVAGVAWAQHRGVDHVEVRVDGGAWQRARLAAEDSTDTWRQWLWEWDATSGEHTLEVRAADRTGETQPEHRVGTIPNGATGWHSVVVNVA
ncbi:molybdopterin-dependent oxidoreductase [Streptantibioticus silvisoli]|uniref:molybdopterin-dependent oxidoreductase n=1 Tax=Streptantibioticus silvisoli TaxID=2705255 RepID=UPI003FD6DD54